MSSRCVGNQRRLLYVTERVDLSMIGRYYTMFPVILFMEISKLTVMIWFALVLKRVLIISTTFRVLFKVANLTNVRSNIQKGEVKKHHEKGTKAKVFRHQLSKVKL